MAVGQCNRRKRLVAMDVFCMFSALIERVVESHTAARWIVSFDQVQVNFLLRLWVTEKCSRKVAGGLAGVYCLGWVEGKVSQPVPGLAQQAMCCW